MKLSRMILLVLALGCGSAAARAETLPLRLDDPATGKRVAIGAGPAALHLVFFATWCPPCRAEFAQLEELEERGGQDYRLVLIAVQNRHTRERLVEFVSSETPPGQVLFDADGTVQRGLGAEHLPTHIILDRDGHEVVRGGELSVGIKAAIERLTGAAPRGGR
jgi:thiol-disulfide isomerase/thioredoxin